MKSLALVFAVALAARASLAAEDPHANHKMPAAKPAAEADAHANHAAPEKPAEDPHAGHAGASNTTTSVQAPPPPNDHAADRIFGAEAMAASREMLHHEHGAHVFSKVMIDTLEYTAQRGQDGMRWQGEAWFGGDINRAVVKTEGEGEISGPAHHAEVQALYSRAIGPYFDLQAGLRHDIKPSPSRTYAVLGLEGLAPYWFEVGAGAFVSDKGDLLARAEASYEQLITQRVILEPRAELNFSAQAMPAQRIGKGLSDIELGLRMRYEVRREFAPYVGITYSRKVGASADLARAAGEDAGETGLAVGIRAWF